MPWYNFHQVWPLTTNPCLNYSVFDANKLCHAGPWPFTFWPWTFTAFRMSRVYTLYKIWAKSNNPVEHFYRTVLTGAWTQLHQTWRLCADAHSYGGGAPSDCDRRRRRADRFLSAAAAAAAARVKTRRRRSAARQLYVDYICVINFTALSNDS